MKEEEEEEEEEEKEEEEEHLLKETSRESTCKYDDISCWSQCASEKEE